MPPHRRKVLLIVFAGALSGCATYPLSVSKSEWEAMSPAQQAEYRKLQSLADNQKRRDADADRRYIDQSMRSAESAASR
jgi:hypothetical protein